MRPRLGSAPTTVAATIGMLLLTGLWSPITEPPEQFRLILPILAVGVVGLASRMLRLPGALVLTLQILSLALATFGPDLARDGMSGVDGGLARVLEAGAQLRGGSIPIESNPGATWLLAILLGALMLSVDVLAVELERPGWGTVPLLVAYLAPTIVLPDAASLTGFAMLGVGVALLLVSESLGGRGHPAGGRGLVTRGAAVVFALAVAAGSVGGAALLSERIHLEPRIDLSDEPIEMNDPSLDLKRNLVEGSEETIIEYTTDLPDPPPLRLVSLSQFADSGFHLVETRISHGPVPPAPGLRNTSVRRVTRVQIGQFASEWLPAPYAPLSVDTDERWGFTELGLEILALGFSGRTSATVDMTYEVKSADVRPSPEELAALSAGRPRDAGVTLEVPDTVSPQLRRLVSDITAGAETDGQKAMAIERFFHSPPFVYSTEPAPGTGVAGMEAFLFDTREGYCEQYAGAMAAMARVAGIPSRIGIGFHPGHADTDGVWQVSARDMHAWPELYFDEWGWVPFEPTPGEPGEEESDDTPAESEEQEQPAEESQPEPEFPDEPAEEEIEPEPVPATGTWGPFPWLLAALLAAAGLGSVPSQLRAAQRRNRLDPALVGSEAALLAWREIRATARDLDVEWPSGSPRFAAEDLASGLEPHAAEALRRVALATEQALYADPSKPTGAESVAEDARLVVDALRSAANPSRARMATLWPRSVWG